MKPSHFSTPAGAVEADGTAMSVVTIKHRWTCDVLYEHKTTDKRVVIGLETRDALEAASENGANLAGAYLGGAKLRGAKLEGSNLRGAKLVGDRPILMIGPIGSRSDYLTAYLTDKGLRIKAGCWFGTADAFEAAVAETHANAPQHMMEYRAALALVREHSDLWTPAAVKEDVFTSLAIEERRP